MVKQYFHPVFQKQPLLAAPTSVYRVEMTSNFSFDQLIGILPLLAERGVQTVYLSPITTAQPGSTHGYNVIDYDHINPELGGEKGFFLFAHALKALDMGLVIDFVPNHMSIEHGTNRWWQDVLKYGQKSLYADFFDIFWEESVPQGKVTLYFLNALLEEAIRDGQLKIIASEDDSFSFCAYKSNTYPINNHGEEKIYKELEHRELEALNADTKFLLDLHDLQFYRLDFWRHVGGINYSRFFGVKELARVRVEDPKVFDAVHAGILRWTQQLVEIGVSVAWRIDHPDGLADPYGYFQRAQQKLSAIDRSGILLIAEKILSGDERLPSNWYEEGLIGTVGYDFLKQMNDLAISKVGLVHLHNAYWKFTGERGDDFETTQIRSNATVLESCFDLKPEFERCARFLAKALAEKSNESNAQLRCALLEVLVRFPIYRTYIGPDGTVSDQDRTYIDEVFAKAKHHQPLLTAEFEKIYSLMLSHKEFPEVNRFVQYFQRISGPLKAKGFEDTALYRHVVEASLHEVGGDPAHVQSIADYHAGMAVRTRDFPYSFAALSTHDTKRGLDTRMRAAALSHLAAEWESWLIENVAANAQYEPQNVVLHRSDIWLLYQTLVAAIPMEWVSTFPSRQLIDHYGERIKAYMLKALQEAKERTVWVKPEGDIGKIYETYEQQICAYLRAILANDHFLARLVAFSKSVVDVAVPLGLGQIALAATSPGIIAIHQGGFDWETSLVDPDNRQWVDHSKGADIKTEMLTKLLKERNHHPGAFIGGMYEPIHISGVNPEAVIAYRRSYSEGAYLIAVMCIPNVPMSQVVLNGLLPHHAYVDVFTGLTIQTNDSGCLVIGGLCKTLPVAFFRE